MSVDRNNKKIAKNTLLLYFRMMLTMVISLYTSRVILQMLGVTDYGIYETVGGIVGIISFLSSALAAGSTRFLAFELGVGDMNRMRRNFSSILIIHFVLAFLVVLIAETVGLWFVYNKLTISPEKIDAAVFAYHLSIITAMVNITQLPYTASIMSHEKMNIYAYLSILEVTLKLIIVYMLTIWDWDRLKLYALLLFIVQTVIAFIYRLYCARNYEETKLRLIFDKAIIRSVLGYSFWNLFTNITLALKNQGAIVLISMFFNPSIVAARAIANKVNMVANQFADNFRTASNPQIIKRYATGDMEGSKKLTILTSKYSFFLMLVLGLPMIFVAEPLLWGWLGQVPDYSVIFLQLAIVTSIVNSMNNSFYTALCAVGKLRMNSIWCSLVSVLTIPIAYVLFKLGYSPVSLAIVILVDDMIISFIVKPLVMIRDAKYTWDDIFKVFTPCFIVALASIPIPLTLYLFKKLIFDNNMQGIISIVFISIISVIISVWLLGIDKGVKIKVKQMAIKKIRKYGIK